VKVAYKVWLENEGKAFGEGPYLLLIGNRKDRLSSSGSYGN